MEPHRGARISPSPIGAQVPGSAVPRYGTRVVASESLDPSTDFRRTNRARIASLNITKFASSARSAQQTDNINQTIFGDDLGYQPYVHVPTDPRPLVPVLLDPNTGALSFNQLPTIGEMNRALPPSMTKSVLVQMVESLLRCVGGTVPSPDDHVVARRAVQPPSDDRIAPRQLQFDGENDDPPHENPDIAAKRYALSTAEITELKSKLEIENIHDWVEDFKYAVGRADKWALRLLAAPDWRALMVDSPEWAVEANKRIATALMASLDSTGPNVVLLKSRLRKSSATDRPGLLYSGMDILDEVTAIVDQRSAGEIKLASKAAECVGFALGASIDESRLVAIQIQKLHELKPAKVRAEENSLHHELISKIPDTSDPLLTMQKKTYENDLHKAEIARPPLPPPWDIDELIDYIAVDIANADPRAKLSSAELSSTEKRTLDANYRCANCGAVGKHMHHECPAECTDGKCGFNFCPGAHGFQCAIKSVIPPSKRNPPLMNALVPPRPIPDHLLKRLDVAWEAKHHKRVADQPRELSMIECDACSDESSDDDDDDGGFGLAYDRS
jgi:hypothetical protein